MTALASLPRPGRAVVVGASGGIGGAVAELIEASGLEVVRLSRSAARAEDRIDLEDEASIAAAAARLADDDIPIRLVFIASGLLQGEGLTPEKTFRALDPQMLAKAFQVNAIGPALAAKHFLPLLPKTGKSVFAALSARVGSIEDNRLGGWHAYRASKAALNQLIRTMAVETARLRPDAVLLALHPGTVDTGLSRPFQSGVAAEKLFTPAYSAARLLEVIDGTDAQSSGRLIAWDGTPIPF
ncbi:SDR family NAD(P)-dependent oxidoreductase [Caulobacter sp. NIBR2454]|uniref:SDR family NAD(P)-dependent oxidoreductase n=1 Tax=Caulobacter sp. NIBR2454 TaxID=3015996 RepID=UPI0022B69079|nr:SDR family NAD(P)-dependent oxidoreductase [Caulobacter sp. NIBR2454]